MNEYYEIDSKPSIVEIAYATCLIIVRDVDDQKLYQSEGFQRRVVRILDHRSRTVAHFEACDQGYLVKL